MKTVQSICLCMLVASATAQQPLTLRQALGLAYNQRPAVAAARLRVEQARFERQSLSALPSTGVHLGYTPSPEVGGADDDLVVFQPLDIFGRTSAFRASGNALIVKAEAEFRQATADVQREVVAAYIDAAASLEFSKTAVSVEGTLQKLYDATRTRVEAGVAPGVQLTRVGLELDQAKLKSERWRAQSEADLLRLAVVIGAQALEARVDGLPALDVSVVDEATVALQRPELLLLAAEVRSADAATGVARVRALPELELQGRRTPWQQRSQQYGVRLQLSFPLFDHGRARSETRAATTQGEVARKTLADRTQAAMGEVRATRIEVELAQRQVSKYETLVGTAHQLVDRLQPALTSQATTMIEVIDATRALRDLEEALVEAKWRLALAQARYVTATGHTLEVSS